MKHVLHIAVTALAGIFVFSTTASTQGRYVGLGRGSASAVSDDGTVVAGTGFSGPYRWTEAGGHVGIASGAQYSETVRGISADGGVITGNTWLGGVQEAGYWRPVLGGWTALGALPGSTGCGSLSSAYGLNADGSVIVGLGWEGCKGRAFRWEQATGMVQLPNFDPNRSARANCVSGDGQVVAGWDEDPNTGSRRASVWYPDSRGEILLLPPTSQNPNGAGEVYDINADGTAMVGWGVGSQGRYAFRWTAVRGVEELGLGSALATNGDASLIGGQTGQFLVLPGGSPAAAFLWTPEDGIMGAETYLLRQGIATGTSTPITAIYDISPDGKYIVGQHGSFLSLNDQGFLVELPDGRRYGFEGGAANTLSMAPGGTSAIGTTFVAMTSNLTLGAGWTLIGTGSAQLPFLGGTFLVDVTGPLLVLPATATGGVMTLNIPIPNNPLLVGASLYLQALAPDAVLPNGWAFSNGLVMTVRN